MPSVSFLFSTVFRFRKVTQEIFSELHGTKTQPPILPSRTRSPKGRRRGAPRLPHHLAARVHPRHASTWCGAHRPLPRFPFRLYKPLRRKTLSTRSEIHEKFRRCQGSRGFWSSSRHPAGGEIDGYELVNPKRKVMM